MYAEIVTGVNQGEVRLYLGTPAYSTLATTSYASSTKVWGLGIPLSNTTSTRSVYTIGPNNLWQGEVWGISTTSTTTVRVIDK